MQVGQKMEFGIVVSFALWAVACQKWWLQPGMGQWRLGECHLVRAIMGQSWLAIRWCWCISRVLASFLWCCAASLRTWFGHAVESAVLGSKREVGMVIRHVHADGRHLSSSSGSVASRVTCILHAVVLSFVFAMLGKVSLVEEDALSLAKCSD